MGSRAEVGRLLKVWALGTRLSLGPGAREPGRRRAGGSEQGWPAPGTWLCTAGWMSSAMVTLPCCSRRLVSLEQQMLTELSTCQWLYSTKERLSITSGPPGPPRSRLASFLASTSFLGSRSPAMVGSGQWGGGAPRSEQGLLRWPRCGLRFRVAGHGARPAGRGSRSAATSEGPGRRLRTQNQARHAPRALPPLGESVPPVSFLTARWTLTHGAGMLRVRGEGPSSLHCPVTGSASAGHSRASGGPEGGAQGLDWSLGPWTPLVPEHDIPPPWLVPHLPLRLPHLPDLQDPLPNSSSSAQPPSLIPDSPMAP